MPETAKPLAPESPAPSQGDRQPAPSRQEKREEPVIWPRDMNAPATTDPDWGSDPEALRDA